MKPFSSCTLNVIESWSVLQIIVVPVKDAGIGNINSVF